MPKQDSEASGLFRKNAQRIAASTAPVINCDLMIVDLDGIIVGAGDTIKIGALFELRDLLASLNDTLEIERGKETTVVAPVRSVSGQTVGAMVLSGAVENVRPLVKIVRQQIEILLREYELNAYSVDRESTLQNLVQDIGSFVPGVNNEAMLLSRAVEWGYNSDMHYIPIAVDLYQFGRYAFAIRERMRGVERAETRILNVKKAVLASVRKIFPAPQNISAMLGNSRFVILFAAAKDDKITESENAILEEARSRAEKILEETEIFGLKAAVGIGSPAYGLGSLAVSYQEAWKALFLGKKFCQRAGVYGIADYRLEDVITTIDLPVRTRFVQAITGKLRRHPDWEQTRDSIREWCESSFSLVEASRRLHVHRNTLIYRLDKLSRETGLDLKDFRTCLNLYIALVMDRYVGPAVKEEDL